MSVKLDSVEWTMKWLNGGLTTLTRSTCVTLVMCFVRYYTHCAANVKTTRAIFKRRPLTE